MKRLLTISLAIILALGLGIVLLPAQPTMAGPVDINVPGDFPTIQEAIDNATSGDTVLVVAGTYSPSTNGEVFPIHMKNGVSLQGEGAAITILDVENTDGVIWCDGISITTTKLDGFTITNGSAVSGGGIYLSNSSPTISNNTILGNTSNYYGGGIYLSNSSPTISNNTILGNTSNYYGGGIYCINNSSPTISGNTISSNNAYQGGGIWANDSSLIISDSLISGNAAHSCGGIYSHDSSLLITNNTISQNSASGVVISRGSSITLDGNTITQNGGAGICIWSASATVSNNIITLNESGGISLDSASPVIVNNLIANNHVYWYGGGICMTYSAPTIANNTIVGNSAYQGGGIYGAWTNSPTIFNNILWYNRGGDLYRVSATYSCIQDLVAGTGNIHEDPLFVNPAAGDYHLQHGSPCIDAGSNAAMPSWLTTDFEGDPRIVDGNGDGVAVVDMGADEYVSRYNTPVGTDVTVVATNPETGDPTPVTVTFNNVTAGGDTTVTTSSTGPLVPTTFRLGNPPTYFDITTTADYEPPVIVCIDYSGITFHKDESELRLLQKTETDWIDVTRLPVDTGNKTICGEVLSLSWFTIVEPNYPPTADAGGPYAGSEGSAITFDGSGSSDLDGTIITYEWDLDGDGLYDDATGPTAPYTWADEYSGNLGLKVTDNAGATDTDVTTVTVSNVAPTVDAGPDQAVNEGDVVSLSGSFTDPGSLDSHTISWDFGDGSTTTGSLTQSHAYGDNGVYTVTLTVTDDDGGVGSDTLVVTVNNVAPEVDAGADREAECGFEVVSFAGSYTDPGWLDTHTYDWDFGDGASADDSLEVSHLYTECKAFTVTLTVTDDDGGVGKDTATVTVVDTTPPEVDIEVPGESQALQDGVTLTASALDFCGVAEVYLYVREPGGADGIPIGFEDIPATLNTTYGKWEYSFDTTQLLDGYYVILAKAVDSSGNEGWSEIVPFSIRNWAVVELLPASARNKGGRTMPVKFSLRIAESVDPEQPFVYNEELEIRIYDSADPGTILQSSLYGDTSLDYRIDSFGEKYITNFKTGKKPADYVVEIWRTANNFPVGSFTFSTVK